MGGIRRESGNSEAIGEIGEDRGKSEEIEGDPGEIREDPGTGSGGVDRAMNPLRFDRNPRMPRRPPPPAPSPRSAGEGENCLPSCGVAILTRSTYLPSPLERGRGALANMGEDAAGDPGAARAGGITHPLQHPTRSRSCRNPMQTLSLTLPEGSPVHRLQTFGFA